MTGLSRPRFRRLVRASGDESRRWEEPSLCAGWTVHDVVAHLVSIAHTTRTRFVLRLARARFDFDRQNGVGIVRHRGATPRETLDRFRAVATWTATPPAPLDSRLAEAFVHGEDVRRPLGLAGSYPTEAVVRALRLQARTSTSFGGGRERLAGLRLRATDADVVLGDCSEVTGAEVTGGVLPLLLAVCGRAVATDELAGPGRELLLRSDREVP